MRNEDRKEDEKEDSILLDRRWASGPNGIKFKVVYQDQEYMINIVPHYKFHLIDYSNRFSSVSMTSFIFIKNKKTNGELGHMINHLRFINGSGKYLFLMNDEELLDEGMLIQDLTLKWIDKNIEEDIVEIKQKNEEEEKEFYSLKKDLQSSPRFSSEEKDGKDEEDGMQMVTIEMPYDSDDQNHDVKMINTKKEKKKKSEKKLKNSEKEEKNEDNLEDWTFLEIESNKTEQTFVDTHKYKIDKVIECDWNIERIKHAFKYVIEETILNQKLITKKKVLKHERNLKVVADHIEKKDCCCCLIYILALFTGFLALALSPVKFFFHFYCFYHYFYRFYYLFDYLFDYLFN